MQLDDQIMTKKTDSIMCISVKSLVGFGLDNSNLNKIRSRLKWSAVLYSHL